MKVLATLFVIGMLATAVAMADDVEDIRAAELDSRAQEKAGNADGVYNYMVPDFSIYPPLQPDWSLTDGMKKVRSACGRDMTRVVSLTSRSGISRSKSMGMQLSALTTWWGRSYFPTANVNDRASE